LGRGLRLYRPTKDAERRVLADRVTPIGDRVMNKEAEQETPTTGTGSRDTTARAAARHLLPIEEDRVHRAGCKACRDLRSAPGSAHGAHSCPACHACPA